jgi:small subunit ribosomal protein S16
MATKIRLRRMGTTGKPFYRVVAADSRFATTGRFLEILGWYDPKKKDENFSLNMERVNYWLGTGAQLSGTAASLVKKAGAGLGVKKESAQAVPAEPVSAVEAPAEEAVKAPETQEA